MVASRDILSRFLVSVLVIVLSDHVQVTISAWTARQPEHCHASSRLTNSTLSQHVVHGSSECLLKCAQTPLCKAFNVEAGTVIAAIGNCELCSETTDRRGNNLVFQEGYTYFEMGDADAGHCEMTGASYEYLMTNVQLESKSSPGYHVTYDVNDGNKAKFVTGYGTSRLDIMSPGLTGEKGTVSLEINGQPGFYFRYRRDTHDLELWGQGHTTHALGTVYRDSTFRLWSSPWYQGYHALESVDLPGRYLADVDHRLIIAGQYNGTEEYATAASFMIGQYTGTPITYLRTEVEIQSINFQTFRLTYQSNNQGSLINGDTKKFNILTPGLTGEAGTISIESVAKPGWYFIYLGESSYYVDLVDSTDHPNIADEVFNQRATYFIRHDVHTVGWFAFESAALSGYYLRHMGYRMYLHANVKSSADAQFRWY